MSRLHGLGQQKPDPALSKAPGSRAKGSLLPGAQGGPFALLSLCAEFSRHLDRFPARQEMPPDGRVWCYSSVFTMYGPCNL